MKFTIDFREIHCWINEHNLLTLAQVQPSIVPLRVDHLRVKILEGN